MKKLLVLFCLLTASTFINASDTPHIFTGSSYSDVQFDKTNYGNYEPAFSLGLAYDYAFDNGLELGTAIGTYIGTSNQLTILVGPGFHFGSDDINSTYFVTLKAGISTSGFHGFTEMTDFYGIFAAGKRISLAKNVSYVPGLRVNYLFITDADPTFVLDIFRFSLFF